MAVIFTPKAKSDLKYWKKAGNLGVQKRIEDLILAILTNPYEGIGNPERLKYHLSEFWSRRINKEHRIVYLIKK